MSLDDQIKHLRRVATLNLFSTEALRLLCFSAETHIARNGEVLFREGDASSGGYILLEGEIALESMGRAPTLVGPDTLIGETALITQTQHPSSATARGNCTILKVPRTLFHRVLREFPDDARKLRKEFAARTKIMQGEMGKVKEKFLG